MSKEITKRQQEVLTYIKKYIVENGYPPAIREIGEALGLSSPATVHTHLNKLISAGYLKKTNSKFRTLEVVGNNEYNKSSDDVIKVPLLGKVTAGSPIEAIERPNEFFSIPASFVPKKKEVFTLQVSGESMINAGIFDGDIIIIERTETAKNGEIVVAMTDENEVTLKRFYRENGRIRLQPENDTMSPIYLNNCKILGIAIGLYRRL